MRIGLVTTIWKRPAVTRLMMEYYAGLEVPGVALVPMAVYSDEDGDNEPCADGWNYVTAPNEPLSNKFNAGCRSLRYMDVGAVIKMDSDDFVTPRYIKGCANAILNHGAEMVHMEGCYMYDAVRHRAMWVYAKTVGLGRCFSAPLLDRLNWEPVSPGLNRRLDGGTNLRLDRAKPTACIIRRGRESGMVGVDVKTGTNIWSYDYIRERAVCISVNPEWMLRSYFPAVADDLMNMEAEICA